MFYTEDHLGEQARLNGWSIGHGSYGAPIIQTWGNDGKLAIGRWCSIAGGVKILLGGNHRTDWITTYPFSAVDSRAAHIAGHPHTHGDVVIGHDVWIGQDVTILSGVTIGDGACVAASSVVVKDVAPYSIVGGNPGRVLKQRFSDSQIKRLLAIRWWDWDPESIIESMDMLLSPDAERFIRYAEGRLERGEIRWIASAAPPRANGAAPAAGGGRANAQRRAGLRSPVLRMRTLVSAIRRRL